MSKVYFIPTKESNNAEVVSGKLERLLTESKVINFIRKDDDVAVKMHFGEEGNTGYVKPRYAKVVCDFVKNKGGEPFLSDTNALYRGRRTNSADHKSLAYEHGFTKDRCGAEILIPDDSKKEAGREIGVNGKFIKTAKVARVFLDSDALIGIAHFKGHIMTGFGGALKNIGMGCATREGKLAQHSNLTPIIHIEGCTGCMECAKSCPTDAISLKNHKAYIDPAKCIGCATCIAVCTNETIDVDWESGGSNLQEKMIEYASAILDSRKKTAFINFAIKITKECDCLAKDDPRIAPDIGIFASLDPVSIDKASFDSVLAACGKDIFKIAHPDRDGMKQLKYAARLGLGELAYELIKL